MGKASSACMNDRAYVGGGDISVCVRVCELCSRGQPALWRATHYTRPPFAPRPPAAPPADLNFLYLSSRLLEFANPQLARVSLSGERRVLFRNVPIIIIIRGLPCLISLPYSCSPPPPPPPPPPPTPPTRMWVCDVCLSQPSWATSAGRCWRRSTSGGRRSTSPPLPPTSSARGRPAWPPAPASTDSSPASGAWASQPVLVGGWVDACKEGVRVRVAALDF